MKGERGGCVCHEETVRVKMRGRGGEHRWELGRLLSGGVGRLERKTPRTKRTTTTGARGRRLNEQIDRGVKRTTDFRPEGVSRLRLKTPSVVEATDPARRATGLQCVYIQSN